MTSRRAPQNRIAAISTRALKSVGLCLAVALALAGAGCDRSGPGAPGVGAGRRLRVVAAENFWGSIAAQLGGRARAVQSIIVNPGTDPHSYQPTRPQTPARSPTPT